MRIILKIIAAPAVLALTLIVAILNFSVSLASWVLGIHNGGSPGWCLLFCFPLSGCPPQPIGWSAGWMISTTC